MTKKLSSIPIFSSAKGRQRVLLIASLGMAGFGFCYYWTAHKPAPPEPGFVHYDLENLPTDSTGQSYHGGGINSHAEVLGSVPETGACLWQPTWLRQVKRVTVGAPAQYSRSLGLAINEQGQVAGYAQGGPDGKDTAFLWQQGNMQPLGTLPGFASSVATAINNHGQVAGRAYTVSDRLPWYAWPSHAFTWQGGSLRDLGVPQGFLNSRAYGLNDQGQVVGWGLSAANRMHALLWQNGVIQDLGTLPGGRVSSATGINNVGQIVGASDDRKGLVHPVLWDQEGIHDLGLAPGSTRCKAFAINNRGQVLGDDLTQGNVFLWDAHHGLRVIDLPKDPDWTLQRSIAINDAGQVVAAGINNTVKETYNQRIFLLTPETE